MGIPVHKNERGAHHVSAELGDRLPRIGALDHPRDRRGPLHTRHPTALVHVRARRPWDELSAGVKAIFVSYMKIAGASQIGVALALGIVLFGPFRRMESWANQTIACVGCVTAALSAYGIYTVQMKTGVPVPWYNPLASFVLFVTGYLLSPRR